MRSKRRKFAALAISALCGTGLASAVVSTRATGSPLEVTKGPPIAIPAASNMSGLARPETARDHAVANAAALQLNALTDGAGAPPGMAPGAPDMARFRVLLDNLGSSHRAIYAVPTRAGRVCGGLTGGPSGCLEGFTAAGPVDFSIGDVDAIGSGEAAIVWGLAPDSVRTVHVVVAGTRYAATMGRNAYYFAFPSSATAPSAVSAIAVDFENGRSQTIAVNLAAAPMAAPH